MYEIAGVVQACVPKLTVITATLPKGHYEMRCQVTGVRDARIPPGAMNWKAVKDVIGLPNGTRMQVEDMRQIKFEWKNGEIVRSIDGKTLDAIRSHSF